VKNKDVKYGRVIRALGLISMKNKDIKIGQGILKGILLYNRSLSKSK